MGGVLLLEIMKREPGTYSKGDRCRNESLRALGRGDEHRPADELGKQVMKRRWCHLGERRKAGQSRQSQMSCPSLCI